LADNPQANVRARLRLAAKPNYCPEAL